MKIKFCLIILTLSLTGCGGFFYRTSVFLPSDNKMEEKFLENGDSFNRLIEMLVEDSSLTFLSANIGASKNKPYFLKDLPDERWNEYQKIFKEINLPSRMNRSRHNGNETIEFFVDSADLFGQGDKLPYDEFDIGEKGYIYSDKELSPLVDSLNYVSDQNLKENSRIFKRIKGNWYLYYSWSARKPE